MSSPLNVLPSDLQNQIKKIKLENYFDKTYENGTRECGYTNSDGELHDICRGWSKSGNLVFHFEYENGNPIKLIEWFNSGKLYRTSTYYEDGKKEKCKVWNEDGDVMYDLMYSW